MKNTDFERKLEQLGLRKKDFTELVGMPYQTLQNWKQKGETPAWVSVLLHYYERSLALDELLKIMARFKQ